MNYTVEYTIDEDVNILTRTFEGVVTITDIIASWEYVINNGLISENYKGVISDFRGVNLQLVEKDFSKLENFFKQNRNIFKNLKMAQIVDIQKIIYPLIFQIGNPGINTKPFSTTEDAKNWIRQ